MYNITVFNSKNNTGKQPYSPYDDGTFDFNTISVESPYDLMRIISNNFVLNIPLDIKSIRCERKKKCLEAYFSQKISWIILDIDKVKNIHDVDKILTYFKSWKCIIGESRSFNGVDNFNLKGFIFCDIELSKLKFALQKLHYDLIDICDVDTAASRMGALNAPTHKVKIIFDGSNNDKILTYTDIDTNIPREKITNIKQIKNIDNLNPTSVDDLCLQMFEIMGFEAISVNENYSISFKHPDEIKTPGGYFWFRNSPFIMHHYNSTKSINIYDNIKKNPIYKELVKKSLNYDNELLKFNTKNLVINVNEQFLTLTEDIKSSILTFLSQKDGLFSIRSPMGTGKSNIIKYIIDNAQQNDMSVLIITNRISVAEDFSQKYKLKLYNKDEYRFGDSLICQFDSLWKYNVKNFDVVILDEFISLLFHSRTTINNSSINCAKFFASFNKKLVIADAFLTGFENKLLQNKSYNLFYLNNNWRDETKLYNYAHFNFFIQELLNKVKHNKVTISSTSLNVINALQILLMKHKIRVVTLTAETPQSTKELIYKYFANSENDKWDVLLYSPTLTVGVSNLNNVKYHFHYDSSMTTDVISSLQMIKRTRKAKEIHFYVKPRINLLKTTYNDIKDDYLTHIGKSIENNHIFNINDYGEPVLSKLGKQCILIDTFKNILEFDHKQAFNYLLKFHFKNDIINIENNFETNVLIKYQKESNENTANISLGLIDQYLSLNELDRQELGSNFIYIDFDSSVEDKVKLEKHMKSLFDLDSKLKYVDTNIKKEIFNIAILDKNFAQRCRYYNIIHTYANDEMTDIMFQSLTSNAILNNNTNELDFLTCVKNLGRNAIQEKYKSSRIVDTNLKRLTQKLGYKTEQIGPGMRAYALDKNIIKYFKYFRI